jgi:pyridoxine 5-phosphate synthase
MILLGVNIDHAATLRQARYREASAEIASLVEPDPVAIAAFAERAGADGITAHLREDRRHIVDGDIERLRKSVKTRLNLEMACTPAMTEIALRVGPAAVCVVPENRREVSTEGGLDVVGGADRLRELVLAMGSAGIETSLFIDPDEAQIASAARIGAPVVELHTGAYANAYPTGRRERELERLRLASARAHSLGLKVNAGHGINYVNIAEVRLIPHLNELNIGHSILSRALFTGIEEAVREMRARMNP